MNAYEQAIDRMEAARRAWQHAARVLAEAEAELDAAGADLAACEQSPGIPRLELRAGYHEHWRPRQPLVQHVHAVGRTPHEHTPEVTS